MSGTIRHSRVKPLNCVVVVKIQVVIHLLGVPSRKLNPSRLRMLHSNRLPGCWTTLTVRQIGWWYLAGYILLISCHVAGYFWQHLTTIPFDSLAPTHHITSTWHDLTSRQITLSRTPGHKCAHGHACVQIHAQVYKANAYCMHCTYVLKSKNMDVDVCKCMHRILSVQSKFFYNFCFRKQTLNLGPSRFHFEKVDPAQSAVRFPVASQRAGNRRSVFKLQGTTVRNSSTWWYNRWKLNEISNCSYINSTFFHFLKRSSCGENSNRIQPVHRWATWFRQLRCHHRPSCVCNLGCTAKDWPRQDHYPWAPHGASGANSAKALPPLPMAPAHGVPPPGPKFVKFHDSCHQSSTWHWGLSHVQRIIQTHGHCEIHINKPPSLMVNHKLVMIN